MSTTLQSLQIPVPNLENRHRRAVLRLAKFRYLEPADMLRSIISEYFWHQDPVYQVETQAWAEEHQNDPDTWERPTWKNPVFIPNLDDSHLRAISRLTVRRDSPPEDVLRSIISEYCWEHDPVYQQETIARFEEHKPELAGA